MVIYFDHQFPTTFATKITIIYLDLYGLTLEDLNENNNSSYELGDYMFSESKQIQSEEDLRIDYITKLKHNNYSFLRSISLYVSSLALGR